MPIDWIPTNPKTNVKNQANQVAMAESEFNEFMRMIIHDAKTYEQKLEVLLYSKGFFTAEQASMIVSIFARPKDRVKSIMILEPKLVSITAQEARHLLACFTIENDRIESLKYIKRALNDAHTQEGVDYILSCFTFPESKHAALKQLQMIVARNDIKIAAGGHQGYAPMGTLYTTAPPNNVHVYGNALYQVRNFPNHQH